MTMLDRIGRLLAPDGAIALSVVVILAVVLKHASFGLVTMTSGLAYYFPIVLLIHIALLSSISDRQMPRWLPWLAHLSLLVGTAFFVDGDADQLPDSALNHLAFHLFGSRPFFTGGGIVLFPFTTLSLLGALSLLACWIAMLAAKRKPRRQHPHPIPSEDPKP